MKVDLHYIARAEGEGSVKFEIRNGKLHELKLNIWEPPRFFEGFLVGRKFDEVPDIVARICGICPVSHMTASIRAIENALGFVPGPGIKRMRDIMALSQTVSSHLVHLYVLVLPDYRGFHSAAEMFPAFEKELKRFIRMKDALNRITALFGGRALHPVAMVVGGFTKPPSGKEIAESARDLETLKDDAHETLGIFSGLQYPSLECDTEYAGISGKTEYAFNEGTLTSTNGMHAQEREYPLYFEEDEVSYSNAKRTIVRGRGSLMVGALSRVNRNFSMLHPEARRAADELGFVIGDKNPFKNILAQALEVVHGIEELKVLLEGVSLKDSLMDVKAGEGSGSAITEAPRGMLYHHYELNRRGLVEKADIVTPTAHNFLSLEEALRKLVEENIQRPQKDISLLCEMLVRAYDPCFSCSVH